MTKCVIHVQKLRIYKLEVGSKISLDDIIFDPKLAHIVVEVVGVGDGVVMQNTVTNGIIRNHDQISAKVERKFHWAVIAPRFTFTNENCEFDGFMSDAACFVGFECPIIVDEQIVVNQ